MPRVVLKLVGVVSIVLAVSATPLSLMAGNPAVLGVGGPLLAALLVGLARDIALLDEIATNTRHQGG